jgi:phosphoglycolate phosphatase
LNLPGLKTVLFDLDGTIIDSYPGIQKAFDNAFYRVYNVKNTKSIKPLIGPPINKILVNCNGETNPDIIDRFVGCFKEFYDSEDLKLSVLYDGMQDLLDELIRRDIKMFVVTNKRERPTKLIIQYLKLERYFCDFYCSDNKGSYPSKELLVHNLLKNERVDATESILVGDTVQDKTAALLNDISFVYAAYGYGQLEDVECKVEKPLDLLEVINYIKA